MRIGSPRVGRLELLPDDDIGDRDGVAAGPMTLVIDGYLSPLSHKSRAFNRHSDSYTEARLYEIGCILREALSSNT